MHSRIIRRGLIGIILLGTLILVGFVALPFIASTQIVKDHLALELSRWSGYKVTFGGKPPVIRVWPKMQAVLDDVRFSEWGSNGSPTVLASDIVEIDLSAFAALRGRIEPQRVRFVRPLLRLRLEDGRYSMPPAIAGRFRHAISAATNLVELEGAPAAELPTESVGIIEMTEGRIVAREPDKDSDTELLTSVSALLQWPTMNRELAFRGTGIWRGENIAMTGAVGSPLLLAAGESSSFRVTLESAPLSGSFNGTVGRDLLGGEISLASPSLGRALEWLDTAIGAQMPSGPVALSGAVTGDFRQLKLEKARLTLGENPGVGTLEFVMRDDVPAISGTLAFDDLDLMQLLTSYSILPDDSLDSHLGDLLSLDLRLSAARAVAGPFDLTNVAAVVQLNERLVTFDISDSVALGGNVVTGIRINRETGGESVEFRLLANDIDGSNLAAATGSNPWIPAARGKISVILKGPLTAPADFFAEANGSITASFTSGTVGSFDLASFLERAAAGGFFALDEVASGAIAFDRAEAKVTMTNGLAAIDKATFTAGGHLIELGGIADYRQRSIALTGRIQPQSESEQNREATTFFVGGSWISPYFSAILPDPPLAVEE